MAMELNRRRSGFERGRFRPGALDELFEQHGGLRDTLCAPLILAAKQRRRILPHRREAARLEKHKAGAAFGQRKKRGRVAHSKISRLGEQAL
jgi:hypothetical protein